MKLLGWSSIPDGWGVHIDLRETPRWLKLLHATPVLDRYSYPLLVRRGDAYLIEDEAAPDREVPAGWTVRVVEEQWSEVRWPKDRKFRFR